MLQSEPFHSLSIVLLASCSVITGNIKNIKTKNSPGDEAISNTWKNLSKNVVVCIQHLLQVWINLDDFPIA
jgi:hypothetical protein